MSNLWLPGTHTVPQTNDGGSMVGGPARVTWHTTESDPGSIVGVTNWLVAQQTFSHLIWDPSTGQTVQFIPANRAARALEHPAGTPETNRAGAVNIQIEVVGRAADPFTAHPMLGRDTLIGWLTSFGIPLGYAIPGRMGWPQWAAFGGHCGHMNVPGQTHVDPGQIDHVALLGQPQGDDDMAHTLLVTRSNGAVYAIPTDLAHKEHITDPVTLTELKTLPDYEVVPPGQFTDTQIDAIPDSKG